tara:strand:- start:273 stop:461 length:189 start_codon:yes stop_codon:yes gene_type:complete
MKPGDLVKIRLPHSEVEEVALLLAKMTLRRAGHADPMDVWWRVNIHGTTKEVHQDYITDTIQ